MGNQRMPSASHEHVARPESLPAEFSLRPAREAITVLGEKGWMVQKVYLPVVVRRTP